MRMQFEAPVARSCVHGRQRREVRHKEVVGAAADVRGHVLLLFLLLVRRGAHVLVEVALVEAHAEEHVQSRLAKTPILRNTSSARLRRLAICFR